MISRRLGLLVQTRTALCLIGHHGITVQIFDPLQIGSRIGHEKSSSTHAKEVASVPIISMSISAVMMATATGLLKICATIQGRERLVSA